MSESPSKFSEEEVAHFWDRSAKLWTEQVRKGMDIFREYFNNPAFFRFVGDLKGKKVLDAGCGEGYNTRIIAGMGAKVVGIDISQKLIEMAMEEERRDPLGIEYSVASFTDLSIFENDLFDVVISTMALMDSPNFEKAVAEIFRVLRPGGELVFSILHPCFVTKGLSWIEDDKGEISKLTVSSYFDQVPRLEEWRFSYAPPDTEPFVHPTFYRTLSLILKALVRTGFVLQDLEEPRPPDEVCKKFPRMRKWREHAALFLYIRAEKPILKRE